MVGYNAFYTYKYSHSNGMKHYGYTGQARNFWLRTGRRLKEMDTMTGTVNRDYKYSQWKSKMRDV